ncbi:MAG TPA: UDP-galactopyranose mutase [Candidatus Merdiplasma excrementigallinarum]|uniref:UDP-galactopyranose mutase n=1 Tax=Candidatus Merdiplasma excrementigallinarum TaxID=2840864 RepID=A0A9D1NZT1_9FIRM|nr:UDP-galactopyranose mutase [Candidatus Merdiplasma excrementigallinarum]
MGKNIIDVDHLSIRFNLANQKVNNLKEYAIKLAKHELMFQEFFALKDVNLHVKPGEAWGLIGTNGSGKSTLLKTITGILKPYQGTVAVRGKIAPMIELGAGFDMELTARENIFLNGAVLGHSNEFMEEHFEDIVEFAGLGKFLDSPIKNFSSGMKARLGFSVATMVDPEILIVDEVLSVGDYQFRKKCNERMEEMLSGGTTLLYVSHNIDSVKKLCTHALWLDHGEVIMSGDAQEVCDSYSTRQEQIFKIERKEKEVKKAQQTGNRYDYLVVGAGLFGAVFAHEAYRAGKRCLVIDKRDHIGGNVYTENVHDINVHRYGAHIFHTGNRAIWNYINQFSEFNNYINSPVAVYKDELYNLPFNMNTFSKLWGLRTPQEVKAKIAEQIKELNITEPRNLEEQALSLVGKDVYEKLVKGYTEKQWGRDCKDLPSFIIKRLPLRFTYDNNYFNDRYQGIPQGGYTQIIQKLLDGIDVELNTDYETYVKEHPDSFDKVLYTGPIDEYFQYSLGHLEYRSVRFETEELDMENYQGNAVVNYTDREVPYTRIIEHKHFEFGTQPTTIISREYSAEWKPGMEPYYPVNDEKNNELFAKYRELAEKEPKVIFGGRLGNYKYYNMDQVIEAALETAGNELKRKLL